MGMWRMQFGIIVLTTSAGIMTHEEARHRKLGGKVRELAVLPFLRHTWLCSCSSRGLSLGGVQCSGSDPCTVAMSGAAAAYVLLARLLQV